MRNLIIDKINFFGKDHGHLDSVSWGPKKHSRFSNCTFGDKHISELSPDFAELSDTEIIELLVTVTRLAYRQR